MNTYCREPLQRLSRGALTISPVRPRRLFFDDCADENSPMPQNGGFAKPVKEAALGGPAASTSMPRPRPPVEPPRSPVQSPPPLPPLLKVPSCPGPGWELVHGYAVPLALLPTGWERIEGEDLVTAVYARLEPSKRGVHPSVVHSTQRVLRYLIGSRLDVRGAARRLQCLSRSRARCPAARIPATLPRLRLDQLPHFERFVASVPFHPCVTFTPEGHPVSLYAINATRRPRAPLAPIVAADAKELLRRVGEYMDGLLFRRSEETHRLLGIVTILDFSGACTQQIRRLWFRVLQPVVAESVRLVEDGYKTYIVNAPPAFCMLWRAAAPLWMSRKLQYDKPGLTEDEIDEIREAFNLFDTDGTGTIDPSELKSAMRSLGFEAKNPTIFQMIADLDQADGSQINFDDFLDAITQKLGDKETRLGISKIFDLFDDDKTGTITLKNLKRVSKELGETMAEEELREMIDKADSNGTGAITLDDFYTLMTKKTFP